MLVSTMHSTITACGDILQERGPQCFDAGGVVMLAISPSFSLPYTEFGRFQYPLSGQIKLTISQSTVPRNAVGGGRIVTMCVNLAPTSWFSIGFVPDRKQLVGFSLLLG
jgi:hypothetical protein